MHGSVRDLPSILVANVIYTNVAAAPCALNVIDYAQQIWLLLLLSPPLPEHLELSSMLAKISRNYNKLKRGRQRMSEGEGDGQGGGDTGNILLLLLLSLGEPICICNTCHTDTCLPPALTAKCCILILCKFSRSLSLSLCFFRTLYALPANIFINFRFKLVTSLGATRLPGSA